MGDVGFEADQADPLPKKKEKKEKKEKSEKAEAKCLSMQPSESRSIVVEWYLTRAMLPVALVNAKVFEDPLAKKLKKDKKAKHEDRPILLGAA